MGNFRRGARGRKIFNTTWNAKTSVITVCVLILLIIACGSYILIRNHNVRIAAEKQNREWEEKISQIFAEEEPIKEEKNEPAKDVIINISMVGDILCENAIYEDAYNSEENTYHFSNMFEDIKSDTLKADIAIGTLETNFVDAPYSGNKLYNAPKQLADALSNVGINVLNTATNHCYDYGSDGIKSTLEYLDKLNISHVGTSMDSSNRVLIKEVRGVKIAFLSYTYGTNNQVASMEEQKQYVNFMNEEEILKDLEDVKGNVDYICVNMHWGEVGSDKVTDEQKKWADFLVQNGADLVIGGHPSSLQPMEIRKNSSDKNVFVAYSIGNYISASEYKNSNIEMILNIQIIKSAENGKTTLKKVTYTPVELVDNGKGTQDRFRLLDIRANKRKYEAEENGAVSEKIYTKLKQSWELIEKLIGKK